MAKKRNSTRADGRIAVQVYIGRDENGKRKYKTVYGYTQKEADEKALELKMSLKKGLDIINSDTPLSTLVDIWFSTKTNVSDHQKETLEGKAKYIKSKLGHLPVSKVSTLNIQNFISELAEQNPKTKKPTAKKTLDDYIKVLIQIFDLAIETHLIFDNPAKSKLISIPKNAPELKRRALTEQEQKWVREYKHRGQRAAMIMMYAGLRAGELRPLLWKDIDFENGTISVNKSVERVGGRSVVKQGTKNKRNRIVYIPQILIDFLKREYEESNADIFQCVCPAASGKMMSETAFERLWESYLRDLNWEYGNRIDNKGNKARSKYNRNGIRWDIERFTPHYLRHTFATICYLAGLSVEETCQQMGHSDIRTTYSIYTHLDQIYKKRKMTKLDEYINSQIEHASQMQVSGS